jgi:hypothetical protein
MQVEETGLIFDAASAPPEARFCSFTNLLQMADGRLVVSFRVGSSKDSADGNIRMAVSEDRGRTWQETFAGFPDTAWAGSPGSLRACSLAEVTPGRLLCAALWVDRSDPSLPFADPETAAILPTRVLLAQSDDLGQHWTPFRELDMSPHRGCAVTGRMLRLHDGSLALAYEAWMEYGDPGPGEHHAALRISSDEGDTWGPPQIVAHDDTGQHLFWDQRLAVHPDDGRLVATFWTYDRPAEQDVPIHVAWGDPDGKGWTYPRSIGVQGQICSPVVMPDGRVVAVYVHRHHPPSLRAICSNDFGATWDAAPEVVFYESMAGRESGATGERDFADYWSDMNIWTFGHAEAVAISDDQVLVAHYGGDSRQMSMHWARIRL